MLLAARVELSRIPSPRRFVAISALFGGNIGAALMQDQRLDGAVRTWHKLDLSSDLGTEEPRMPILNA
jgi:hypothetical protein